MLISSGAGIQPAKATTKVMPAASSAVSGKLSENELQSSCGKTKSVAVKVSKPMALSKTLIDRSSHLNPPVLSKIATSAMSMILPTCSDASGISAERSNSLKIAAVTSVTAAATVNIDPKVSRATIAKVQVPCRLYPSSRETPVA